MDWNNYKKKLKSSNSVAARVIGEAEAEALIISSIIKQRELLGLSQRELASLCSIPQSTVARIESGKCTPRLETVLKLFSVLGLTFTIVPTIQ